MEQAAAVSETEATAAAEAMTDEQLRQWAERRRRELDIVTTDGNLPTPPPPKSSNANEISDFFKGAAPAAIPAAASAATAFLPFQRTARSHIEPDAVTCPDCDTACSWRCVMPAIETAGMLAVFERAECLCEVRHREQREAQTASEDAARREAERYSRIVRNKKNSGIVGQMVRLTFDTFDAGRSPSMADAAAQLRAWAEGFKAGETLRGFTLSSPRYGCGKSHLAVATARVLLERGYSVRVTTMAELLSAIRSEFGGGNRGAVGRTMEQAQSADVLLIDDFGVERIASDERGDWTREQIFTLMDTRCRYGKPVLVTTNLSLRGIEERIGGDHGGRIASRLMQLATWLDVDGPDGRVTT
jgi:DNA replication protein DnaC